MRARGRRNVLTLAAPSAERCGRYEVMPSDGDRFSWGLPETGTYAGALAGWKRPRMPVVGSCRVRVVRGSRKRRR